MNLSGQTVWEKYPGNPVMTVGPEEWEDPVLLPGSVIFYEDEYHMWYCGGDFLANGGFFRIGHATSNDGIAWTRDLLPVLDTGSLGEWDDKSVWNPSVLLKDGVFHMWYSGYGNEDETGHGEDEIGHATSADGITWIKDEKNPVLKEGNEGHWDDPVVVAPSVIYDGTEYHMYYHASGSPSNGSIGHATSPDGTVWTRDPQNPVISKGAWDTPQTVYGGALFHNNTYYMWYSGGSFLDWDIGYATSEDGSSWTKFGDGPVLEKGAEGFDTQLISAPSLIYDNNESRYKMWYRGQKADGTGGIGYAESDPFVLIPDTAFLYALIDEGVDTNGDSLISYAEAMLVDSLNIGNSSFDSTYLHVGDNIYCNSRGTIASLDGLDAFKNLQFLDCSCNRIPSLDVSKNTNLEYLNCCYNQLTTIDVSGNYKLKDLICSDNLNRSIDVSNNPGLVYLDCSESNLTSLDVTRNPKLTHLDCSDQYIPELDMSNCPDLKSLNCHHNLLKELHLSNNTQLIYLWTHENQLTSLDLSHNSALTELVCSSNQLTSLDVSGCTALKYLSYNGKELTSLDVTGCIALRELHFYGNQLTSLDVSDCIALRGLQCSGNQLTSLDVSNNTELQFLHCSNNPLSTLDISCNTQVGNPVLCEEEWYCSRLDISDIPSLTEVCVWESFHPDSIFLNREGSENIQFNYKCGSCSSSGTNEYPISEFSIYPNPAGDILTIESDISDHFLINITSLNGQLQYSTTLEGTTHQIDLSSYQKGVYIITIRSKDFVTTRKIIKL